LGYLHSAQQWWAGRFGDGIPNGHTFDSELAENYNQVEPSDAVVGRTVLRYADPGPSNSGEKGHGAIYMGKDRSGNEYVFSKNGWFYAPSVFQKSVVDMIYSSLNFAD